MNNQRIISCFAAVAAVFYASEAQAGLEAGVNMTNNYVWRGVSQTDNKPAVQGNIQYNDDTSGLYAGLWGSNVNFEDFDGNTVTSEIDEFAGLAKSFDNGLGFDLNFTYYSYPDASSVSYGEVYLKGSYEWLTLGVAYTNDYGGTEGTGVYYSLDVEHEVPEKLAMGLSGVTATAGIGYYDLDEQAGNSYVDYRAGLTKAINKIFSIGIMGTDTNGKLLGDSLDGPHLLVNLTAVMS